MERPPTRRRLPISLAWLVALLVVVSGVVAVIVAMRPAAPGQAGVGTELAPPTSATQSGSAAAPSAVAPSAAAPSTAAPSTPAPSASTGGEVEASRTPSSSPVPDPTIIVAGDIASCDTDGDEKTAALLDGLDGTIVTAGDNVYPEATRETLERCFHPSWGRHKDRIRPAAGNHDWDDGLDDYLAYFGPAAVNEDGDPWYTWREGSWQVIVLASDCEEADGCERDSRQGRWLADTLAASDARCTVAVFHHPRFTSGEHGSSDTVADFWELLYAAGAEIVVNGHDHEYERFAPQDPDGNADPEAGIREFVVGTGGIGLRPFASEEANSEMRSATSHGVLALRLGDGSYEWTFHSVDGAFRDEGSGVCH